MRQRSMKRMHGKAKILREDMKVLQQMITNKSVYAGRAALYKRRPKHRKMLIPNYRLEYGNQ